MSTTFRLNRLGAQVTYVLAVAFFLGGTLFEGPAFTTIAFANPTGVTLIMSLLGIVWLSFSTYIIYSRSELKWYVKIVLDMIALALALVAGLIFIFSPVSQLTTQLSKAWFGITQGILVATIVTITVVMLGKLLLGVYDIPQVPII